MSILDFVTQEQLDDLDDDPRNAFMQLVNHAQRSLSTKLRRYNTDEEREWREAEDLRHSFMNVVMASAKRYEIQPFASMEVPRINDNLDYKQFKADLDHYITQLVLDNSARTKRDSVLILPDSKDKIRSYIHALRDCIEKGNMTPAKRDALIKRLAELEAELEKKRANMLLVAKLAFEVLAIPGGTWASYEIANKLITNISQTVQESREAEQANRPLAITKPVPALSAPRKERSLFGSNPNTKGGITDDLDDDVPF